MVDGALTSTITIENGCVASANTPSDAPIVPVYVPAVVGVPVIAPLTGLSESPGGSEPDATAKVDANVPVAVTVWEYAWVAPGRRRAARDGRGHPALA